MERKFDIKLEQKKDHNIIVRFYSKNKLNLLIRDIKAYYDCCKSDEYKVAIVSIQLDNSAKIKTFLFPKTNDAYTSLNLIAKDETNKVQYAVRISLIDHEDKVEYKEMIYEGTR